MPVDGDERPVGLFQSGGLSSLAVGIWLAEQGVSTRHYIADIGQATAAEIRLLADSLRTYGTEVEIVDIRARMAEVASDLLRYRARHDGGYWNTTGASRFVLVEQLAPRMRTDGCRSLAHGCVGGGNDQRRFERYVARLGAAEPGGHLSVYAPWTDPDALRRFPDRATMAKAVARHGLRVDTGSGVDRSTDANLAGTSHESAELEELGTAVTGLDPRFSRWPTDAPAEPEEITIEFAGGRVVDVDGSGPEPLAWLTRCNEVGARHGIWLRDVVERRIIGTVCRGVYEAPGLELLDRAWSRILQASLDAPSRELYDRLATVVGAAMYEGRWPDPAAAAARAAIDVLVAPVAGRITLLVHHGIATVAATHVPARVPQQTRFGSGGHRWSLAAAG